MKLSQHYITPKSPEGDFTDSVSNVSNVSIAPFRGLGVALLLFCLSFGLVSAQNAVSILDKAAETYTGSDGITVDYTLNMQSQDYGNESFEGVMHLKGDKFVLYTPDNITWFDGKTQWTYMVHAEEVNISEPTDEDLQNTNPMLILSNYKKDFKASYSGESTASNGKTAYDILLTPNKKRDIEKIELQVEKFSSLPAGVKLYMTNGVVVRIGVTKTQTKTGQTDDFFRFNEKEYPNTEVIDIR